jgi:hypothetical protein
VYRPFLKGTVIVTDYGRGIEDRADIAAFITLTGPSCTLIGVWIFYPRQGIPLFFGEMVRHWGQSEFPGHSLSMDNSSNWESCTVSKILLQNSDSGVDFSNFGASYILKHIWGQPLREAIRIGTCMDVDESWTYIWPFWDHGADQKIVDPSMTPSFETSPIDVVLH